MITLARIGNLLDLIEELELNGIMNAANGYGPMGAGIAGAIRRSGGGEIEADAFRVCAKQKPIAGESYSTISGSLKDRGILRIIHAVTMNRADIVEKAFISAIALAKAEGITHIGCTALGTGIGGLSKKEVAKIMVRIASEVELDIAIVDFNEEFIREVLKAIQEK